MESTRPEDSERRLQKQSIAGGPVTCVSLLSDTFCWVARGSFLELAPLVYEGPTKRRTHLVFPNGCTIHGVQHNGNISVVFGGRQLAVLHGGRSVNEPIHVAEILCDSRQKPPRASNALTLSDWIWDVKLVVQKDESSCSHLKVAVGLANNVCELWVLQRKETTDLLYKAVRQRRIIGATRSITYSMCFFGWNESKTGSFTELMLASGTVSNEILIWTAVDTEETKSFLPRTTCSVPDTHSYQCIQGPKDFCLRGHVGVIHDVRFDETGELLASASDDRSVRLWQRTKGGEWALQWTGWSHKARVWRIIFSSQGVISCGEDAAAKIWCKNDGSLLGEFRVHNCQSLWSIDVRDNLALVGCNDGTAKLWIPNSRIIHACDESSIAARADSGSDTTLATFLVPDDRFSLDDENDTPISQSASTDTMNEDEIISYEDLSSNHRKKKATVKATKQTICGLDFYQTGDKRRKLLASTRAGSLFSLCLESYAWQVLEPWSTPSMGLSAADGSCIAIHASGKLVAVGTNRGDIVFVNLSSVDGNDCNKIAERRRHCSARSFLSIKRLAWLDESTLLSFHIKGFVIIWRFGDLQSDLFLCQDKIEPHRVLNTTTKAVPTCFAYISKDNSLLVGDSRGNIALFRRLDQPSNGRVHRPASLASRVHKKEHVNDVLYLSNGKIVSVGNDGYIRHSIFNASVELESILSIQLSCLPGPSHIYEPKCGNGDKDNVIVAGYHGNSFLAVDLSSGYEVFRVETGGRQRTHCSFVDLDPSPECFPASYGMAVCINRGDGLNEIMVQSCVGATKVSEKLTIQHNVGVPLHGEPVFDLCLFTSHPRADYRMLLTGSEDCTARVSVVTNSEVVASTLLPSQTSCIRAVSSSRHSNDHTTLLIVCGGKMTVHFYALIDQTVDCHEKTLSDTKRLCKMITRHIGTGYYSFKPSIDPRINAVQSMPLENGNDVRHVVFTGDSDGSIHLFTVSDMQAAPRTIPGQLLYTLGRPVLSLEVVALHDSRIFVIAGITDGSIVMWLLPTIDFTLPIAPLGKYDAHRIGTNSISALLVDEIEDEVQIRICSGGDDQSLAVCTVNLLVHEEVQPSPRCLKIVSFVRLDVASASAIKGVKLVDADHILSVGYSQRLALWQVVSDPDALKLLSMSAVDVADVNCFSVSDDNNSIAVGGLGIELFQIKSK